MNTPFVTHTIIGILVTLAWSCQQVQQAPPSFPAPTTIDTIASFTWPNSLDRSTYYDKVLGALVGSAIGDAMGAPVEMWHRRTIFEQWGYIDGLVPLIREGAPEGPWEDNLPEGGTTDDTRWKYFMIHFMTSQPAYAHLDNRSFAKSIVDQYLTETKELQAIDSFDPEPIDRAYRHLVWLQEWAKVAKPFFENNLEAYSFALNRFYGGEMACGGMLYAPAIGLAYPGQPDLAYREAFQLGIFDIGYARDISGLTAAFVAEAMSTNTSIDDILAVNYETDPMKYFNSRLIGRQAFNTYKSARFIAHTTEQLTKEDIDPTISLPKGFKRDSLAWFKMNRAFELLDQQLQHIPFHANEIHLINLTALAFANGDFQKAMEFVVNYGRDNDTVAAVTGTILGAYLGYKRLPQLLAQQTIEVNREQLGIDLEDLAQRMVEHRLPE